MKVYVKVPYVNVPVLLLVCDPKKVKRSKGKRKMLSGCLTETNSFISF